MPLYHDDNHVDFAEKKIREVAVWLKGYRLTNEQFDQLDQAMGDLYLDLVCQCKDPHYAQTKCVTISESKPVDDKEKFDDSMKGL